ncbi:hypothetical protein F3Y22_tig00014444pilonHSYRG00041 [Hibiscus syriacus]|uniref:Uncharacterized protein n=1 Tax=Hibiscus syriacus TaxID=106335 RepID=A0A6A3BYV3_HIBSY|nr:hypothetical protein F3Y22_tig00014444pilonHSYRG00041 [Hibiscus syriacus]
MGQFRLQQQVMALKPYPSTLMSLASSSHPPKLSRIRCFPAFHTLNEPIKAHHLPSLRAVKPRLVCRMKGSGCFYFMKSISMKIVHL